MGQFKISEFLTLALLLSLGLKDLLAQERIAIDLNSDIPNDGRWTVVCNGGYGNLSTHINCRGGINIPPGDLNGERGFWTNCGDRCELHYQIQPGDFSLKARVYQKGRLPGIDYYSRRDIINLGEVIQGEGWIEYTKTFDTGRFNHVTLYLYRSNWVDFSALDKIVINGDFVPPTTTTTDPPWSTTLDPECPTSESCSTNAKNVLRRHQPL